MSSRLAIITASTNVLRAAGCIQSWQAHAATNPHIEILDNGGPNDQYLGVVPAFRMAIDQVLAKTNAEVICAFHDDLEIREDGWDRQVLAHFDAHPACGLAGFGGATGLGINALYKIPYEPMQLARLGFRSNMVDAECHGVRSLIPERVACLDGFSQIGRLEFWLGRGGPLLSDDDREPSDRPWTYLEDLGVIHHFYDGMLGCLAKRYGWETWYLPIACLHYGGRTAVGDPGYQEWAKTKTTEGDHGFWEQAHHIGYEAFRDVLPLRI